MFRLLQTVLFLTDSVFDALWDDLTIKSDVSVSSKKRISPFWFTCFDKTIDSISGLSHEKVILQ